MPIQCVCPGCGKTLGVPDHALGMQVRCQACQLVFTAEAPTNSATPQLELEPAPAPAAPIAETPLKPARSSEASAEPPPMPQEPEPLIRRPAMVRTRSSTPIVLIVLLGVLGVGGVVVLTCIGGVACRYRCHALGCGSAAMVLPAVEPCLGGQMATVSQTDWR